MHKKWNVVYPHNLDEQEWLNLSVFPAIVQKRIAHYHNGLFGSTLFFKDGDRYVLTLEKDFDTRTNLSRYEGCKGRKIAVFLETLTITITEYERIYRDGKSYHQNQNSKIIECKE